MQRLIFVYFLLFSMACIDLLSQEIILNPWFIQNAYVPNTSPGSQSMVKDHLGRLWVATTEGVHYYDGARLHKLDGVNPSFSLLKDIHITALFIDSKRQLWIGTFEFGLFVYHLDKKTINHYEADPFEPCALLDNRIMYIFEDISQNIWIGLSQKGIHKYLGNSECTFHHFLPLADPDVIVDQSHFPNIVLSIKQDKDESDILWLGTMRGLWKYSISRDTAEVFYLRDPIKFPDPSNSLSIRSMCWHESNGGKYLYLATWGGGIWCFDLSDYSFHQFISGDGNFRENNFLLIEKWGDDHFILGATLKGLSVFSTIDSSFQWLGQDKLNYSVYSPSAFYVTDGVFWLTEGSNRHFFHDTRHNMLKRTQLPTKDLVKTIYDAKSDAWFSISSYSCCLYRTRSHGNTQTDKYCLAEKILPDSEKFHDIVISRDGLIFVISNYQIYLFDEKHGLKPFHIHQFNQLNIPNNTALLKACIDHQDNIWIGTNWEGLLKVNIAQRTMEAFKESQTDNGLVHSFWIYGLHVDQLGNIWYATAKGFGYFDVQKEKFVNFRPPYRMLDHPYLNFERLVDIYADSLTGSVFIGSQSKGLGYIQTTEDEIAVSAFTKESGLRGDRIWQIESDGAGRIFLLTNRGISFLHTQSKQFINIGEEYGLQHLRNIKWTKKGLLIGVRDGFYLIDPDSITTVQRTIQPVLLKLNIAGKDINFSDINQSQKLVLSHSDNFLAFEIGCDQLLYRELLRFSYMMKGLDTDWIESGNEFTGTYAGMPSGKFELLVRVALDGDQWSEPLSLVSFSILPPFYKRSWFIILSLALLLLILRVLHKRRTASIRREEQLKSEFDKLVAESEMKALRSQMNPHFLFNCLNSIKVFMVENNIEAASKYMNKFARLIGLILENSELPLISLQKEMDAIQLYVALEKLRFEESFQFKIIVDEYIDPELVQIPPLLLQPYVENAIWHGLLPKKGERNLSIHIRHSSNDFLTISIEDNGIGRAQAKLHKTSRIRSRSMGMQITEKRINMANTIHDLQASVEVLDLLDERGNSKGTRVNVNLLK